MTGAADEAAVARDRHERATAPDSIVRNTGFSAALRLTSAVFTAGLTLFLVRYLGPEDYGVFALALSVGVLVLIPSNLGIAQASARFIAERRGDPDAVAEVTADALVLKVAIGAACSLALAALAGPIANAYGSPALEAPLRIMALAIFFQGMLLFYDGAFEALGRLSAYLRVIGAESVTETGASIAFVLLGGGAAGAMWGRAAGYGLASVLGFLVLARTIGRSLRPKLRGSYGHRRGIFAYGSALVVVEGAFTAFAKIDVLLIGAILSISSVGLFEAPMRLVAFLSLAGSAVAAGVAPRLARSSSGEPDSRALLSAMRWLLLLQGVLIAPLLVWAGPIADVTLGDQYAESADVLRAIVPYALLVGISPLMAHTVNYLGEGRRRVPIAIGALLINFLIDLALLSPIGIVAGAIGTDVAYTLYVGAHFSICRRLLGLRLSELAPTALRMAAAAAVMSAVLLAFGTSNLGGLTIAVGAVLALAAYTGTLFVAGAVSRSELNALRARFAAARGRSRAAPGQG